MNHCVKSVSIRTYSGPHFRAFGLNTERYGVSLSIQSECGKMWTRITPNTDGFHAVIHYERNITCFQNLQDLKETGEVLVMFKFRLRVTSCIIRM